MRDLSVILLVLIAVPAVALTPALRIDQYGHTAWKIGDGSFKGYPRTLAQTTDGYLWLGTEFGIVRFDGVRFVRWRPPAGQGLPSEFVTHLLGGRDGSLWIGTSGGLARWKDGRLVTIRALAGQRVAALFEDARGRLWVGTHGGLTAPGQLCSVDGDTGRCSGGDGRFGRFVNAIHEDDAHVLWLGTATGLWTWHEDTARQQWTMHSPQEIRGISTYGGSMLISLRDQLTRVRGERLVGDPALASPFKPTRILTDRDGALWVGTQDGGLLHFGPGRPSRYGVVDSLSGGVVLDMLEDREGNIWVATIGGLDRFRNLPVSLMSSRDGLSSDTVTAVLVDHQSTLWIATANGLNHWLAGRVSVFAPGTSIQSLLEDHEQRVWLSTRAGLQFLANGRLHPIAGNAGAVHALAQDRAGRIWAADQERGLMQVTPSGISRVIPKSTFGGRAIRTMVAAPSGGLWLGYYQGGIDFFDGTTVQRQLQAVDGLPWGTVSQLVPASDGGVWVAAQGGAAHVSTDRITAIPVASEPGCEAVHWIAEDSERTVWAYTACGLLRMPRPRADSGTAGGGPIAFDDTDGVMLSGSVEGYSPIVTRSTDGRLWFSTFNGVAVVDPSRLSFNDAPPPVFIEEVLANGEQFGGHAPLTLASPLRDLRIDFTATSLTMPAKMRFRYKLEGRDTGWVDAGGRRQAIYTDLPPKSYRFRVLATNNEGIWNETGAILAVTILPAFYQTAWFAAGCVVAGSVILLSLYRARVRRMTTRLRERFEGRLDERARIAQDLHDTLLQGMISMSMQLHVVAAELREQPAQRKLEYILDGIHSVIDEGRRKITQLRAEYESDTLEDVLRRDCQAMRGDQPIELAMVVEGQPCPLHPLIRDDVYRVAREALTNAFRHAGAARIEVVVAYRPDQFAVHVRDNGCGIQPEVIKHGRSGHWGIQGMRERADRIGASLRILSGTTGGTELVVTVAGVAAFAVDRHKAKVPAMLRRLRPRGRSLRQRL